MKSWNRHLGLLCVASLLSAPLLAGKHEHDHHDHHEHGHDKHEKHDDHKKHDNDHHGHDHEEHRHHGAHVHGFAELKLAIEGKQVLIELETPAANVVGFEHAPENAEQKKKVAKAVKSLQDYRNLLVLKDGDCVQKKAEVESPFEADEHDHHKHDHGHEHDDHKEEKKEETHSDFDIGYELACKSAKKINGVELTVFKHFPGFEKIKVEWVSESGQGAKDATQEHAIVKLK